MGGRVDHAAAVLHGLLRFASKTVLLLAEREVILLAPPRLAVDLPAEAVVSIFPLAPCTGRSEGLLWPIDGLAFAAGQTIGTSNKALGGQVTIDMEAPGGVLFLPKAALPQIMQALQTGAPEHARWPVRA